MRYLVLLISEFAEIRLFDHSLQRNADVLDAAILHAHREPGFTIEPPLRQVRQQLCERLFNLFNFIPLRDHLYTCLNHGVTIAVSNSISTRIFGHLEFAKRGRQGDKEKGTHRPPALPRGSPPLLVSLSPPLTLHFNQYRPYTRPGSSVPGRSPIPSAGSMFVEIGFRS